MKVSILTGLLGIFFPAGIAFIILAFQAKSDGNIFNSILYMVMGGVFWLAGMYVWRGLGKVLKEETQTELEKFTAQLIELKGIRSDIRDSFNGMENAINKLINEIRQDRNEHNNSK